uniref:Secreted protein n=1 Tax=Utricularia reniformis TaxID=192314 RepID=A0A1Y0AZB4_9LAMI|nr:hypothetical protein AEK19_MT0237 [Utricularia reniformis]ART30515.1 hypothetical protein AEK19_MT0237 [Utricularia reniformis]
MCLWLFLMCKFLLLSTLTKRPCKAVAPRNPFFLWNSSSTNLWLSMQLTLDRAQLFDVSSSRISVPNSTR